MLREKRCELVHEGPQSPRGPASWVPPSPSHGQGYRHREVERFLQAHTDGKRLHGICSPVLWVLTAPPRLCPPDMGRG